ncbi:hypothetical protein F528_1508 [Neisseria meningitidis 992008]|nr:hypothetical protein F528_1508 [Neisseria meningitidis 992008]
MRKPDYPENAVLGQFLKAPKPLLKPALVLLHHERRRNVF